MTRQDLGAVLAVQQTCYPQAYHEPEAAFGAKLAGAPDCSWVAEDPQAGVQAYLVCLPVDVDSFPALHAPHWQRPRQADWLYLHDLAVSRVLQGVGVGHLLVEQACSQARALRVGGLALVAVQGSVPYWQRHGFAPTEPRHPALSAKLASFGDDACFMTQVL